MEQLTGAKFWNTKYSTNPGVFRETIHTHTGALLVANGMRIGRTNRSSFSDTDFRCRGGEPSD